MDGRTHLFKVVIVCFFPEMTDLEFWTFMCIVSVFLSLLSYGVILIKDQMIIQVGSHLGVIQIKDPIIKYNMKMRVPNVYGGAKNLLFVPVHCKTRNLPLSLLFNCYLMIDCIYTIAYITNISLSLLILFFTLSCHI